MIEKEKVFNQEDLDCYLKYRLNINLVILSFFLLLHCFFGFTIYFIFAILLCFILFDSMQNAITYFVFYYPFCMIEIPVNAILFAVLVGVFLIRYIVKTYIIDKVKPDATLFFMLILFLIYCFLPFGPYSANMFTRVVIFVGLFFALSIAINKTEIIRFKFNVKILALAIIVACIFSLTWHFSPFLADYLSNQPGRFKALFVEPNILATFCEVICAILLYYILSDKAGKVEYLLFAALAILGFFTMSKAFFFVMLIELIALFFYAMQNNWKKTLIVVGILAVVGTIFGLIFHEFVADYFNRFLNGNVEFENFAEFLNVITTGRYELWALYFDEIINNPIILFFGAGVGATPIGPLNLGAHNLYISMVYQLGLFGSILFVGILAYMIVKIKRKTNAHVKSAIALPIIVLAMLCFFEDIIFYMNPI